MPYADLNNPQSLNLYGYVLNNPLARFDPDGHDGFWDLAKQYLNVIEVKVSASLGTQVSGQWGVAKGEAHSTLIGIEGKTGLAGGGREAKVTTGIGASGSAGPVKADASVGAQASTTDGISGSAGAKVAVGPAAVSANASVDQNGGHATVGPEVSVNADHDFKIGGSVTDGIGAGVAVNFSQLGRAWDSTVDSFNTLGSAIKDKFMPTESTPPRDPFNIPH